MGLLTSLGLYVRWTGQTETRRRNTTDAQSALNEQRDERFTTAIEHLADTQDPAVQIGGFYTLEALAKDDPDNRSEQILTSFTEDDRKRRTAAFDEDPSPSGRQIGALAARVAYAATARASSLGTQLDLGAADLLGANLSGAVMLVAELDGANLLGAQLAGADLVGANLANASLKSAYLDGAYLDSANLDSANLGGANLGGATMKGTKGLGSHPSHNHWIEAPEAGAE